MENNLTHKKIKCLLLAMTILLSLSSCSYNESFHNKAFIFYCNYTDLDVELQVVWPGKKKNKVLLPTRELKDETYKFWFKKSPPHSAQAILLQKGKPIQNLSLGYPNKGLYTFCAYGGLYTRINILLDKNGAPYMQTTYDLDP